MAGGLLGPHMEAESLRLVIGLGNPGEEYAGTRHNIGFQVVDALLRKIRAAEGEGPLHQANSMIWKRRYARRQLWLQKPLTWMNASGPAVAKLSRKIDVSPGATIVVYDDLDLDLGRLRLRPGGGSGGHRGVESIIDSLGGNEFARLRLGIGSGETDAIDHVLSVFAADEQELVGQVVEAAAKAVLLAFRRGLEHAMNSYNGLHLGAAAENTNNNEDAAC